MVRLREETTEGRGLFVVFEGLDGSGTTTQANLLAGWLAEHGLRVEFTHEPSTGPIGGLTRSVIDGRLTVAPSALALMFAADRVDHLFHPGGIMEALRRGVTVISDRYVLSSLAYQASQGLSVEWLTQINSAAVEPDVTIFLDTAVDVCVERIGRRRERAELFHEKRKLAMIEAEYKRVLSRGEFTGELVTADGNQDPATVAKQTQDQLLQIAERRPSPAWQRLLTRS